MDIKDLLEPRLDTEEYEIPGVGRITVRALTRFELLLGGKLTGDQGAAVMEAHMLHFAMVDPEITFDQARAWQKACSAGELQPIVKLINRLSGIGEGADKSRVHGDGVGPDVGMGALHSGETVDDGSAATDGNDRG